MDYEQIIAVHLWLQINVPIKAPYFATFFDEFSSLCQKKITRKLIGDFITLQRKQENFHSIVQFLGK